MAKVLRILPDYDTLLQNSKNTVIPFSAIFSCVNHATSKKRSFADEVDAPPLALPKVEKISPKPEKFPQC